MYSDSYEAFEYQEHLEELIDGGHQVVSVTTGRGRGRMSGADIQMVLSGLDAARRQGHPPRLVPDQAGSTNRRRALDVSRA